MSTVSQATAECPRGHPLAGANVYPRPGYVSCWVCKLLERKNYWRKRGRDYNPGPGAAIRIERLRAEGFALPEFPDVLVHEVRD